MSKDWGGARQGAGRKPNPNPKIQIKVYLDAENVEWMDGQTKNRSEFINRLLADNKNSPPPPDNNEQSES